MYTDSAHYEGTGYDRAWRAALEDRGVEVDQLPAIPHAWATGGPPPPGHYDLVIPHVLVEEAAVFAPTLRLASLLEATGTPLLNPTHALLASADKLATHAVWARHGILQPRTYDLEQLDAWPEAPGTPYVLKPSWCDAGRHITTVHDLDEAREHLEAWREDERRGGERRGTALLQEWVREPRVLRIFATPDRTSLAYEKDREDGAVVTHGTTYPTVAPPERHVAELAQRMVATLGGGLMGVDVLIDQDGRALALEANAPFGFDVTDPEQGGWVADAAIRAAGGGGAAALAQAA